MKKHYCIVCKKEIYESQSKYCADCFTYESVSADIEDWFTGMKSIFNEEEMDVIYSFDSFLRSNLYESYHNKISSSGFSIEQSKDPIYTLKRAKLEKVDKETAGQF